MSFYNDFTNSYLKNSYNMKCKKRRNNNVIKNLKRTLKNNSQYIAIVFTEPYFKGRPK